jgi:Fe-S-cluster-containing dehydrogenase component
MIGEGTRSTNQRRHNYVQENVEVGFFTDPTVCIGCKACEVACSGTLRNESTTGQIWRDRGRGQALHA